MAAIMDIQEYIPRGPLDEDDRKDMERISICHSYVLLGAEEKEDTFVHVMQYSYGFSNIICPGKRDPAHSYNLRSAFTENTSHSRPRRFIIFVPGNPGSVSVYNDFLLAMFTPIMQRFRLETERPTLIAIGHNSSEHPVHTAYTFKVEERITLHYGEIELAVLEDPHNIESQIRAKQVILNRLFRATGGDELRFYFVGHSIGCYIIMRMLAEDIMLRERTQRVIFLQPTLDNLATTPRGAQLSRLLEWQTDWLITLVGTVLDYLLPMAGKRLVLRAFLDSNFLRQCSLYTLNSFTRLACAKHFKATVGMARSELRQVRELQPQMLELFQDKLYVFYANQDHWVHESRARQMAASNPRVEMLDSKHAFITDYDSCQDYAQRVASLVMNKIDAEEEEYENRTISSTDSTTNTDQSTQSNASSVLSGF